MDGFAAEAIEKFKADPGPYAIRAVFVGENTDDPGLDGARWDFCITNGLKLEAIQADLSGTNGGHRDMEIDVAALEEVVEHMASRFPQDSRLEDMAQSSPLVIRREETGIVFS